MNDHSDDLRRARALRRHHADRAEELLGRTDAAPASVKQARVAEAHAHALLAIYYQREAK